MTELKIESARALLLQQQRQFDDWCKRLRSDDLRLRNLQRELFPSPVADLPDLLTSCRCTRATRNHAAVVIEMYRIRCQQLLDITGIPQTLAGKGGAR